MHSQIESIFDEAENRYLNPEELGVLSQYVQSLPGRLETYRQLRDRELDIMQQIADQLQAQMPQEKVEALERSIKNALLMLRHCGMAMLLDDEVMVRERLLSWLSKTIQVYNTREIDAKLYQLLNQKLSQVFTPQQMSLLNPVLTLAQNELLKQVPASAA